MNVIANDSNDNLRAWLARQVEVVPSANRLNSGVLLKTDAKSLKHFDLGGRMPEQKNPFLVQPFLFLLNKFYVNRPGF